MHTLQRFENLERVFLLTRISLVIMCEEFGKILKRSRDFPAIVPGEGRPGYGDRFLAGRGPSRRKNGLSGIW